jgi:hypothetical protein
VVEGFFGSAKLMKVSALSPPLPQTVRESLQKWGDRIVELETGAHIEHCLGRAGKIADDSSLERLRVEIGQIRRSVSPALVGVKRVWQALITPTPSAIRSSTLIAADLRDFSRSAMRIVTAKASSSPTES